MTYEPFMFETKLIGGKRFSGNVFKCKILLCLTERFFKGNQYNK